jgi:GTPase SAR1 family protein
VIVYDVSSRASFKGMQKWIDDVKSQRGEGAIVAVLGNKIDVEEREISEEEGKNFAQQNDVLFKEVSAKSGANVQEFFKEIAALLPEAVDQTSRAPPSPSPAKLTEEPSISEGASSANNKPTINLKTE